MTAATPRGTLLSMNTTTRMRNALVFVAAAMSFVVTVLVATNATISPVSYLLLGGLAAGCGWHRWPGQWALAVRGCLGGLVAFWSTAGLAALLSV